MKKPENAKELESFIGAVNYYRGFVKNFADLEVALRGAIHDNNLVWSTTTDSAYEQLVKELKRLPSLAPYSYSATRLELHTDASNKAIGAVLNQYVDDKPLPVGYYSRVLKDNERNYSTTEKELLAAHDALLHFRHHLTDR